MKKISIFLLTFLLVPVGTFAAYGIQTKTSHCIAGALPDSACTPGAVLTTNIKLICTVGYTKTVRDVSAATKKKVFAEYGIPYDQHSNYEVDHLISLEIGGSNDISNLFPESYSIKNNAHSKDSFENYLHKQLCNGSISIAAAQKEISSNWLKYDLIRRGASAKDSQSVATSTPTSTPVIAPVIPKTTPAVIPVVVPVSVPAPVQNIAPAPTPTPDPIPAAMPSGLPQVKKSSTGICHERGSTYYDRTLNYIPYDSIQACLLSGGRLPLR